LLLYAGGMNDLLDLRPRCWNLHIIPPSYRSQFLTMAASLAYRGPLTILDCGRQYDPTLAAIALEGRAEIADRIKTRHAFICSESVRLLQSTPISKAPVIVLDLLSSFYDENVRVNQRQFLLENAIQQLNRICRGSGAGVIVYPPPSSAVSLQLFNRLKFAATRVVTYETPPPLYQQGMLFP
jgi:hypothetical protein